MQPVQRVGVFTSGGDAPGMNACVRAVTRTLLHRDMEVVGIRRGYAGMIAGDMVDMDGRSVSNILQMGGTILKSARSDAFRSVEGRQMAAEHLRTAMIDAVIGIGGDGTLAGLHLLHEEHGFAVVGCPGTIDNDLYGTDETIGFDTALNTAIENIDRIRDTADAHDRLFLVEVMGRDSGFIALNCAIGGGAEMVLLPEKDSSLEEVRKHLHSLLTVHSRSSIVIVAEGDKYGATEMAKFLDAEPSFDHIDIRVCILGHTQRGGSPSARDRVLASRLGAFAARVLAEGSNSVMVGLQNQQLTTTPLADVCARKKDIDFSLIDLAYLLE